MTILLACLTKAEKKIKRNNNEAECDERSGSLNCIFVQHTKQQKGFGKRDTVTTTFYMVHIVHFYFLILVSSDLFLLFDRVFLSGNLLGLGGLVQGGYRQENGGWLSQTGNIVTRNRIC